MILYSSKEHDIACYIFVANVFDSFQQSFDAAAAAKTGGNAENASKAGSSDAEAKLVV